MRPLWFGDLQTQDDIVRALRQIEEASNDDINTVADGYTLTGTLTDSRTIHVTTGTLAELLQFVGTLISDLKKRGAKRA